MKTTQTQGRRQRKGQSEQDMQRQHRRRGQRTFYSAAWRGREFGVRYIERAGKGSEDAASAHTKLMFIILVFILEVMEYH